MTTGFVQLDRLTAGPYVLGWEQMAPVHKKRIESCLSSYFLNRVPPHQKTSFQLNLKDRSLVLNGEKISLVSCRSLKEVGRVIRYYQHMGLLPSQVMEPQAAKLRKKSTQAAVRAIRQASIPGTNGQILAGARIADDGLSLTRNILFAIPAIGPDDPVVNHLGYYAGILWAFFSFRELDGGFQDLKRAKEIGDGEGRRRANARLTSGGIMTTASLTYLAGRVCDTLSASTAAAAAFGVANVLFGVGALLSVGVSALGWTRCHRFNERLNEYLENSDLAEVQKLQGALQFLKDTISITPEEVAHLRGTIEKEHPGLSGMAKEQLLQKKLTDLTEVKVKYLKRRTSTKSLELILNRVDPLLMKLAHAATRPEGIKEALVLLQQVQNENRTKMALFILGFIASVISFIAMIVCTVLTTGVLPFVLYGIAGGIFLSLQIYSAAGVFRKKEAPSTGCLKSLEAAC